jgi:glutathione synthase/RimK-type ligase-like ATP-grasp enzyme
LPIEVSQPIRTLVSRLGLEYCAIDLIKTSAGDYFFLEVNPSGQFLFVEMPVLMRTRPKQW